MRSSLVVAAALLAACYAPDPQPGAPCAMNADCPRPLVCSPQLTCERTHAGIAPPDAPPDATPIDGCAPTAEICGDGVDDDCDGADLPCAANDGPDGAIDVTAGGMFEGDVGLATDDVGEDGCGGAGGRDLFFRVVLGAPQVYYFDTFGSTYDTVIRVHAGSCADVGAGDRSAACVEGSCGGAQSQIAASLPAGESCIVVDERAGAQGPGALALRVVRGGRDGMPLARGAQTSIGDTCTATNTREPNCDGSNTGAKDHTYFFTTCPGETLRLDADTCPEPDWDPVLYVRRVEGNLLGCNDDACGLGSRLTNVPISNSALYFLFVDGYEAGECGSYRLDTNLRP